MGRSLNGSIRWLGIHVTLSLNNSDEVKGILGTGENKIENWNFEKN